MSVVSGVSMFCVFVLGAGAHPALAIRGGAGPPHRLSYGYDPIVPTTVRMLASMPVLGGQISLSRTRLGRRMLTVPRRCAAGTEKNSQAVTTGRGPREGSAGYPLACVVVLVFVF